MANEVTSDSIQLDSLDTETHLTLQGAGHHQCGVQLTIVDPKAWAAGDRVVTLDLVNALQLHSWLTQHLGDALAPLTRGGS